MTLYRVIDEFSFENGPCDDEGQWFGADCLKEAEAKAKLRAGKTDKTHLVVGYEVDVDNPREFAEAMFAEMLLPRKKRNPMRLMKLGQYGEGADIVFEAKGR